MNELKTIPARGTSAGHAEFFFDVLEYFGIEYEVFDELTVKKLILKKENKLIEAEISQRYLTGRIVKKH